MSEVFAGATGPFLTPMVADLTVSGGGNVSYVPIPFRKGCEVTLVGAGTAKIWFQVTARLVEDPRCAFVHRRGITGWPAIAARALRQRPLAGWNASPISGTVVLAPGGGHVIATLDGPDLINGLILRVARKHWPRLGLQFTFDDREPLLIPVLDLFGRPGTEGGATRSLLVGVDADDDLYCYFPMPFFDGVKVELLRRPVEGPARVRVEYALRTAGAPPPADAGYFGVQIRRHGKGVPGSPLTMAELEGRGALVGLVTELRSSDGKNWAFLERDEQIFIDGEELPSWHGTGVEDLFNGGFYFRDQSGKPETFITALAGAPDRSSVERRGRNVPLAAR